MDSTTITKLQLCNMFDHTNLKADADTLAFTQLCEEAKDHHFAMVAINSSPVALCKNLLKNTNVHVGAAISFPLGQTTIETKLFEIQNSIDQGADEIDYVINIGELKNGNLQYIRSEMEQIVSLCKSKQVICKVIFENCYLTKDEIVSVAKIAKEVKPHFIKTSTGFGVSGATPEDVKLMKQTVGPLVNVKAAGGIRSWETCKSMIDSGAERIGTSSSLKILQEFEAENHK